MDKPRVIEVEAQECARTATQIAEALRTGAPLHDELETWLDDLVARAASTKAAYYNWLGWREGAEELRD